MDYKSSAILGDGFTLGLLWVAYPQNRLNPNRNFNDFICLQTIAVTLPHQLKIRRVSPGTEGC